ALQTSRTRLGLHPLVDLESWAISDQPFGYFYDPDFRHRQPEKSPELGSQVFVCQNPNGLRVVLEFGDVEMVIGCAEQMGLGPAAHLPYVLDCVNSDRLFHLGELRIERN